jgi:hypothetical protein
MLGAFRRSEEEYFRDIESARRNTFNELEKIFSMH